MTSQTLGAMAQLGYVVSEGGYERMLEQWICRGVGPFFEMKNVSLKTQMYRGGATSVDMSIALAYAGSMQIEVIVQHNEAPSLYLDHLKEVPEGGLHHIAYLSDDYEASVALAESMGTPLVQEWTDVIGNRYGYCERSTPREPYTEILQANKALRGMFRHIQKSAEGWDGTHPRRTLGA